MSEGGVTWRKSNKQLIFHENICAQKSGRLRPSLTIYPEDMKDYVIQVLKEFIKKKTEGNNPDMRWEIRVQLEVQVAQHRSGYHGL